MLPGLSDPFWVGLLAKVLATAAIVVAVSALVERVGPFSDVGPDSLTRAVMETRLGSMPA
jgi:hypothetical protein